MIEIRKIKIETEKKVLRKDFEACFEEVKGSDYYEKYADEKYRHSMQVLGAGNYILKNEVIFQNKSEGYLKTAKLVSLFHDIGRFKEIALLCKNPSSKHKHGLYSYERLKDLGYSDWRLLLPVKQHGGIATALVTDEEYQQIGDEKVRKETEELYRLVKDADKIANFHIIKNECRVMQDIFFENLTDEAKKAPLSPIALTCIKEKRLVKHAECYSLCDRLVQVLCQIFELYYRPSFKYLKKHDLLEPIFELLRENNHDTEKQAYIEKEILAEMSNKLSESN